MSWQGIYPCFLYSGQGKGGSAGPAALLDILPPRRGPFFYFFADPQPLFRSSRYGEEPLRESLAMHAGQGVPLVDNCLLGCGEFAQSLVHLLFGGEMFG